MTATSAPSASTHANPFPELATGGAGLRTVLLPGSPATYANRAYLRALGLRWDPERHREPVHGLRHVRLDGFPSEHPADRVPIHSRFLRELTQGEPRVVQNAYRMAFQSRRRTRPLLHGRANRRCG